jgi:hypothetical protein
VLRALPCSGKGAHLLKIRERAPFGAIFADLPARLIACPISIAAH